MAWLPFYASESDLPTLLEHFNTSEEIAFVVANGAGKWIAVQSIESLKDGRYCLWHVPSGPLPLFRNAKETPGEITNPFAGWSDARTGVDIVEPFFGAGHPGVFWLNVRCKAKDRASGEPLVGLSSIEWIGNYFKVIGIAAKPETAKFWEALGRWIKKVAIKVPRCGPQEPTPPEIWALSGAQAMFKAGVKGGNV